MINSLISKKVILIIAILGMILIAIFQGGLYSSNSTTNTVIEEPVKVTTTVPNNLNDSTILPTQAIEVSFNYPIENKDEIKYTLEPKIDYKLELINDRKTIKITPNNPYQLGTGYTLSIFKDTKFENGRRLTDPQVFHYKTIIYRGI